MSLGTWIQLIGRASVTIVSWFQMSTGSVLEPALPCISLASQEAPDCVELHTLWTWIIVSHLLNAVIVEVESSGKADRRLAGLKAALELVEDGDSLKRVRIICLPTLVRLDSSELEGDVNIVFFTIPRMFLVTDFHEVGQCRPFVNATQLPECDALCSKKVVFHILADHFRLEDIRVRLELCLIGSLPFSLCALCPDIAVSTREQYKKCEAPHR